MAAAYASGNDRRRLQPNNGGVGIKTCGAKPVLNGVFSNDVKTITNVFSRILIMTINNDIRNQ